jgi:hypothetical protein
MIASPEVLISGFASTLKGILLQILGILQLIGTHYDMPASLFCVSHTASPIHSIELSAKHVKKLIENKKFSSRGCAGLHQRVHLLELWSVTHVIKLTPVF